MASEKSKDLSKKLATRLKKMAFYNLMDEITPFLEANGDIQADKKSSIMQYQKEMEKLIKTLKDNPFLQDVMLGAVEKTEPAAELTAEEQSKQVSSAALGIAGLTSQKYKEEIAKGLAKLPEDTELSEDARFLWDIVIAALLLEPAPEVLSELAEALGTTADLLSKAGLMAREKETEGLLPGCEPTAEDLANRRIYPAPPYIYPENTIIPTAELFRTMHKLHFTDTEEGALAEIGIDRRPHERYIYMLMLDKLAEQYPITAGDKNILIALGNLYGERQSSGNTGIQNGSIITAEDIIRRYRGYTAEDTVEQESIDAVAKRMEILSKLQVSFDFSQHFEYRKKQIGTGEEVELCIPDDMRRIDPNTRTVIRFSYTGAMVHANTIKVEYQGGKICKAWEILRPPIVFDYAQKIKQVATIETKLLDLRKKAKKCTNNNTGADIMKVYLIERINAMENSSTHLAKENYPKVITLASMFEALRIDINNRVTKKSKIDMAKTILDHFKTTPNKHRGHFITDYKIIKGYRGAVTGFEIVFDVDGKKRESLTEPGGIANGTPRNP